MIVADTNLMVYLLLPGERTEDAERAYQRDAEWVAPLLWRPEFRNVLALYMRQGLLPLPRALTLMRRAEEMMNGREYAVSSEQILPLVDHSTCSAYDCEFVALAQDLGVPLVTADQRIWQAFPDTAQSLDAFGQT